MSQIIAYISMSIHIIIIKDFKKWHPVRLKGKTLKITN